MEWYYAIDKQQHGPVTAEQLAELARLGTVQAATLVWCKGMTDWQPYEKVMAPSAAGGIPPLTPGLPMSGGVPSPDEWAAQVKDTPVYLNVGECFGKGWEMFQKNMPVTIGVILLFFLVNLAFGFVPILGSLASLLLTGPLIGGLLYYFVLMVRGRECLVGTAFAGFGPRFVPLMLAGLLISLIGALCVLPIVGVFIAMIVSFGLVGAAPSNMQDVVALLSGSMLVMFFIAVFLMVFVATFVTVLLQFTYPLILDKGVELMVAVRLSLRKCYNNLFSLLLMFFLGWLLLVAGGLMCGVGLLFTAPWFLATLAVAYDQLFPGVTSQSR
jgi:uncharacterized membrane protein